MSGINYYDMSVTRDKFTKLLPILEKSCVINVAGLTATSKDISDIGMRRHALLGKVFDILIRLLQSTFFQGICIEKTAEFLESRFVSLLVRNYDSFTKSNSKSKVSYVFPKSLVDCLVKSCSTGNASKRFYLPYNVDKKHWIGLCFDFSDDKIYILDCNSSLRTDAALHRELQPISVMFPVLLQYCGLVEVEETPGFAVERVKGVAQNPNPQDSALTATLLIQTHALFGSDTCRCITPAVLDDEAQRAAVMIYEFHAKL